MKKKIENFAFWIVAFIFAVAVIAVYKTFDNFNSIMEFLGKLVTALSPFITGFVIAYVLNIPIKRINRLLSKTKIKFVSSHSLGISILVSYIGAVAVIALVVGAVVPAIYKNLSDFYQNLNVYLANFKEYVKNVELFKRYDILQNFDEFDISGSLFSLMKRVDSASVQKYAVGFFSATSGIVNVVVSIIASVYMIIEKDTIIACCKRGVNAFVKESWTDDVFSYCNRINEVFTSYIYSRVLVCLAMGLLCFVVLSVMRVRYAFALGMFIGFCDIIPYFGSIFATIVAIFINLLSGGVWNTVWIGIVLLILQQIDGNIIAPKIMGNKLEISPLLTVVSVVVGGKLFGFVGMALSVPIAAVLKIVLADIITAVENKKQISS